MLQLQPNPPSLPEPLQSRTTLWRSAALALLFILELTALSVWLDGASLASGDVLVQFARSWGSWTLRVVVGFATLFGALIWLRKKQDVVQLDTLLLARPLSRPLLVLHACAMAVFGGLSFVLFSGSASAALLSAWILTGLAAIACGALAFVPDFAWRKLTKGTGLLWAYTLAAVIAACFAGNASRSLWLPASRVTFGMVQFMLTPFFPHIVAEPAKMLLGTQRFSVEIAPECSGLEGVALMAAFASIWLFLFRKEYRFPQAFLLIPAGISLIFFANAVRIAALIAIGDRGAERIALGGFHSQAGWIAFNVIALGIVAGAGKIPWIAADSARSRPARSQVTTTNPTAPWVLPFVVILATGMLTHAMSADFEWLYPLRFFTAAAALWAFREKYRALDWRIGWAGPAAGLIVFCLWLLLEQTGKSVPESMPPSLAAAHVWQRDSWIVFRTLAATITVPLAEELAFRGFLLRRVLSPDFESVSLKRFSWVAIAISSVLFGLLHGDRWIAGAIAGLVYALVLARRGRIGEAVAAHATTNLLIAADVLLFHQWQLW